MVHDVLGTDHDLAVALFAQRSRVLRLHADRRLTVFGQAGVIEHHYSMCRAPLDEQADPLFVEGERIPGGVGQQLLQLLQRGCRHRLGNGLTVFAWQIGQQAGDVAFHRATTGRTPKQRGKWRQKGCQFWQGIGRAFGQHERFHAASLPQN